jgi:hypothetical protein
MEFCARSALAGACRDDYGSALSECINRFAFTRSQVVRAKDATNAELLGKGAAQRTSRLEGAIDSAVQLAPRHLEAIVDAFQSLRGVAKATAITLATEFGTFRAFLRLAVTH